MEPTFPVFILAKDSGEVMKFWSVIEMQRELEPIDIENGEYEAWDKDGNMLKMRVQKSVWLVLESSSILSSRSLISVLNEFAGKHGVEVAGNRQESPEGLFDYITVQAKKIAKNKPT